LLFTNGGEPQSCPVMRRAQTMSRRVSQFGDSGFDVVEHGVARRADLVEIVKPVGERLVKRSNRREL
jgi:hypothetical protein